MSDEADPRNNPKHNPIGTALVFEDESVRVWRIDMRWNQGSLRHALRNVGTKRFRNVIIEIKGRRTSA